jgi:glycosyltransferase involved in cell wall biosynthesis
MHVLVDARLYSSEFTGIGRYTYELLEEFFKQKPDWKFTIFLGEKEFKVFIPPSKNIKKILANEKIYSVREQTTFLFKLNKVSADITWFPHFTVPYFYNRPYITTVHDLTLSFFPGKKMNSFIHRTVYFLVLRNALKNSKHILTVSNHTKKDLVKHENIQKEKISVVYNAVNNTFFNKSEDFYKKYQSYKNFFLYTGQHRSHKNLLGMVKGFHLFLKTTKETFYLIITGKKSDLYTEVSEYCKNNNLNMNIIFLGLVGEKELIFLYQNARAYIFPSFYEGAGIPPLESMASKTPVIASFSSSIPEICGDAVLYFDPYKPKTLASNLEKIIEDKDLQKDLINKGLKQVRKYSWHESAKKILDKFEVYSR